jgi:hypothetical protein
MKDFSFTCVVALDAKETEAAERRAAACGLGMKAWLIAVITTAVDRALEPDKVIAAACREPPTNSVK